MAISAKQHAQICQKIIRYMKSNAPIQVIAHSNEIHCFIQFLYLPIATYSYGRH